MDEEFEVPPHVQELVATDNSRFEDWVRQVKDFRVRLSCSFKRESTSDKMSLKNKHLRNGDYFEIIAFYSHFIFLTNNATSGQIGAP